MNKSKSTSKALVLSNKDGEELVVCKNCPTLHYENCGTCAGWGVLKSHKGDSLIPILAHKQSIMEYKRHGLPLPWEACPECGSTPGGLQVNEDYGKDTTTMPEIKNYIRELAEERGMTQMQLAKISGVYRGTLSKFWKGKTHLKEANPFKLAQIAEGLNKGGKWEQLKWCDLIDIPTLSRIRKLSPTLAETLQETYDLRLSSLEKEMDKFLLPEEYEGENNEQG